MRNLRIFNVKPGPGPFTFRDSLNCAHIISKYKPKVVQTTRTKAFIRSEADLKRKTTAKLNN